MYKIARPFFIWVQTPLHAGSGNDLGIIDLPIQREKHTSYPKIEASGLKGSIRESFEELKGKELDGFGKIDQESIDLVFGPENAGSDGHAGALGFSDARLLLFPVKSMKGVFVWVTCPQVLKRFERDLKICAPDGSMLTKFFAKKDDSESYANIPDELTVSNLSEIEVKAHKIVLEEYAFPVTETRSTMEFANKLSAELGIEEIKRKVVVLPDETFKDFVQLSTEVITRTKIDSESGTVKDGSLFTEEYLPSESILYSLALVSPLFVENEAKKGKFKAESTEGEIQKIKDFFVNGLPEVMQIGGNATLGKGIVIMKVVSG
ncbi:MAG: type III-B CRISPR module RAMP protein Cmr4 [Firmicutes bacterium]|nr:type III-B CRISPR module RAMP protein Cmr4 [Bacillota bacterium]